MKRDATERIHLPHQQATGFYGVAATYAKYVFFVPACALCSTQFKHLRFVGSLLLFLPWLAWFAIPFLESARLADAWGTLVVIPITMSAAAVLVFVIRAWRRAAFRILHIGEQGITFGFRRKEYATAFAEANGTTTAWKLVVVKVA